MQNANNRSNIINLPFIDYIIKMYAPGILTDTKKYENIRMGLFRQAMMHSSTCTKQTDLSYERFEYLGDAIFHMIITEYLYKRYDDEQIGFLTKLRIKIERGESMAELTNILQLDQYIQYHNIYLNDHILEDVFEAFIGAFYLNFGIGHTRDFIIQLLEHHKDFAVMIAYDDNYKDILLQYFHKIKWGYPKYTEGTVCSGNQSQFSNVHQSQFSDPSQIRKYVSIVKNPFGKVLGKGVASSKKKAEQLASKNALISVGVILNDSIDPNWIITIEAKLTAETETDTKLNSKSEKTLLEDENKLSVYNPNNVLMKKDDIKSILNMYNVPYPKNIKTNFKIFHEAMTHKSYIKRKNLTPKDKLSAKTSVALQRRSNERLQFLGDAIIHFIIGEHLFNKYTDKDEGFMTRLRCKLENRDSLFYLAKQINIDKYILLSQNIDVLYGNRNNINIVGGGLEAFVGALYLEFGLGPAREFILEVIRAELDIDKIAENETNYKEIISQIYVKNRWGYPVYRILKEEGPDHAKIFTMGLYYDGKLMTWGKAKSKKKAEQIASKKMHKLLQDQGII